MKRTLILAGVGFAIALAVSTTIIVLRTPARPPAARPPAVAPAAPAAPAATAATPAAPAADSTGRASAAAAARSNPGPAASATPAVSTTAASAPVAAATTTVTTAHDAGRGPRTAPAPRPVTPPRNVITPSDYGAVAKILNGMKPAAAAEILKRLDDEQVEGILRSLGARQASTMLGLLPPDRGAALSRRLMRPAEAGGKR